MMFNKKEESHRKRGTSLPFVLFRMCLSLAMLSIFGLLVFQAYRYFSGVDPLKVDPKIAITSLITSEGGAQLAKDLLSFQFPKSLQDIKQIANDSKQTEESDQTESSDGDSVSTHKGALLFKFAIVTDTHNDNANLVKALNQAKAAGSKFIIGLGDFSDVGTVEELQMTKNQFEASGLPYYVTAGDHDLWDCRNRSQTPTCNFSRVFGSDYQSFEYQNTRLVLFDNSDNYLGVDGVAMAWLKDELDRAKAGHPKLVLAFMQEPLYHPSSDHVMGKSNPKLAKQATELVDLLKDAGVKEVFFGDTHFYARYNDPRSNLKMTTVGAVTEARNAQHPRFAIIDVYEDGSYNVADTEIK